MSKKIFTGAMGHLSAYSKMDIIIIPELRDLIPPLSKDELAQLQQNIIQEGCREPLLVWERFNSDTEETDFVLIDGHNRYAICQQNNIKFKTKNLEFDSFTDVKNWMIDNQLGRRNLKPEQVSYLRGLRYNTEKQDKGGNRKSNPQNDGLIPTAKKLAKEYNVSTATIERDADYSKGLDKIGATNPDLKKQILSGGIKVKKSDIQKLAKIKAPKVQSVEDISKIISPTTTKKNQYQTKTEVNMAIKSLINKGIQTKKEYQKLKELTEQLGIYFK